MRCRKIARMAVLVFFLTGLSCGVLAPKAEAAFFTETPELNQVVPLSPMMNPEHAATVEKARRENISFTEARSKELKERQVKGALIGFIILVTILGVLRAIPFCIRGIGKGLIAVDDARQKIKKASLRSIGKRLADGNNCRHS